MRTILVLCFTILVLVPGCSGDSAPPASDPTPDLFLAGFSDLEEGTAAMFEAHMAVMERVFSGAFPAASVDSTFLSYNGTTQIWTAWVQVSSEGGRTFTVIDTVEFIQGGVPVGTPHPDSLDLVLSSMSLAAESGGTHLANLDSNWIPDPAPGSQDRYLVNAFGDLIAGTSPGNDSTACAVLGAMTLAITNISLDRFGSDLGCPPLGAAEYSGSLAVDCGEDGVSGDWRVSIAFRQDRADYEIVRGSSRWDVRVPCSAP